VRHDLHGRAASATVGGVVPPSFGRTSPGPPLARDPPDRAGRRARPTTRTTMAGIDDIISSIPLDQLAGRLGVDEATAQQAVGAALPALLGGLQANAQDPAGAASLGEAITQHDPSLVEGGVDLDAVDTADGEKIVRHV